jgi:hypothetical protein
MAETLSYVTWGLSLLRVHHERLDYRNHYYLTGVIGSEAGSAFGASSKRLLYWWIG